MRHVASLLPGVLLYILAVELPDAHSSLLVRRKKTNASVLASWKAAFLWISGGALSQERRGRRRADEAHDEHMSESGFHTQLFNRACFEFQMAWGSAKQGGFKKLSFLAAVPLTPASFELKLGGGRWET